MKPIVEPLEITEILKSIFVIPLLLFLLMFDLSTDFSAVDIFYNKFCIPPQV